MQTDKVSAEHKSLEEIRSQLQLVLLDFGLAEELTPRVRKHFISFLHMISAGNGRRAAHHMLLFSSKQECPRPEAFADDMEKLFDVEAQIDGPEGIDVDKVSLRFVLGFSHRWSFICASVDLINITCPGCLLNFNSQDSIRATYNIFPTRTTFCKEWADVCGSKASHVDLLALCLVIWRWELVSNACLCCWTQRYAYLHLTALTLALLGCLRHMLWPDQRSRMDCRSAMATLQVLKDVLKLARRHEVGIDSSYAALVLGVCVIVGFATSLDNRINIMDAATPCFLQHSLTGKASGRLY